MRTILLSASILLMASTAQATAVLSAKDPKASEMMIPLFNTGKFISVEDFIKLTPKEYKLITGKKISMKERIALTFGKKSLKRTINKDGTVNIERIKKAGFFGGWQWHWGGFALGFFLSILGPIVALFFNDDYKWDRFWTALHTSLYVFLIAGIIVAATGGGY